MFKVHIIYKHALKLQFLLAALTSRSQAEEGNMNHRAWPKVVITWALLAPMAGPVGAGAPWGAMPESHPVAGSPGKPRWVPTSQPGSFGSRYFHTEGFCRGLQGGKGKGYYLILFSYIH